MARAWRLCLIFTNVMYVKCLSLHVVRLSSWNFDKNDVDVTILDHIEDLLTMLLKLRASTE